MSPQGLNYSRYLASLSGLILKVLKFITGIMPWFVRDVNYNIPSVSTNPCKRNTGRLNFI